MKSNPAPKNLVCLMTRPLKKAVLTSVKKYIDK